MTQMQARAGTFLTLMLLALVTSSAGQWLHVSLAHDCGSVASATDCASHDHRPEPATPHEPTEDEDCSQCEFLTVVKSQVLAGGQTLETMTPERITALTIESEVAPSHTGLYCIRGRAPPIA